MVGTIVVCAEEDGDVNSDTDVDVLDVLLAILYVLEVETFDECAFEAANVNDDPSINVLDIDSIANLITP